jgi:hypothetical protein
MTRRIAALALGIVSVGVIAFACQTTGEAPQPPPAGKIEVAHWLETDLWVEPVVFLLGAAVLFAAVALAVRSYEPSTSAYLVWLAGPALVLTAAIVLFIGWDVMHSGQPVLSYRLLQDWGVPQ